MFARATATLFVLLVSTAVCAQQSTISITGPSLTVSQGGCVSVLGGNCSQEGNTGGTYYSPTGATNARVAPVVDQSSASYTSSYESFYNSFSANAVGSFAVQANSTGVTLTASGTSTTATNQTCSQAGGPCPYPVVADASASTSFAAGVSITAPTYFSLSFSGAPTVSSGSTSNGTSLSGWFGTNISGDYTLSGLLQPGYYPINADAQGDANTCTGCFADSLAQFSLSLTLSSTPISPAALPPAALIELVVGGVLVPGPATSVQANEGDFVQFTAQDSSDSNVPRSPLAYLWRQISGPTGQSFAFTNPLFNIIVPYVGGVGGMMTYQLTVTNALGYSASATVNIHIKVANHPPVASIVQPAQPFAEGSLVTLDASATKDPDGDALTYTWTQTAGPTGFPFVALNLTNPAKPTFTAPRVGTLAKYQFLLVVSDGQLTSTAVVNLQTIPIAAITVPSVVGATQSAAGAAIVASGLIVGTTAQQSSMTIISGLVVSQSPSAGASVADGSAVNLVVSSGSTCADLQQVKAAFGSKLGQPAYRAIADVNHDGVVNIIDLSTVARALAAGTVCD
jgi:hypothetical protein